MGRKRQYESDAERVAAWRKRQRDEMDRLRKHAGVEPPPPKLRHRGPEELRRTLAKALGQMLGSDSEHQRENAKAVVIMLQRQSGLSWFELLGVKEKP